jgi:DNA repair photolyase
MAKKPNQMYDWVGPRLNPIGGECPHLCRYCHVQCGVASWSGKYSGPLYLDEKVMRKKLGTGKVYFICSNNDMFAHEIPTEWIPAILAHCQEFPKNKYVFQTKNPGYVEPYLSEFPPDYLIGTTIETNRPTDLVSKAPRPGERAAAMVHLRELGAKVYVSGEPLMDFDLEIYLEWMKAIKPEFISLGADSKRSNLHEPSKDKVKALLSGLKSGGISVKIKPNLARLLK